MGKSKLSIDLEEHTTDLDKSEQSLGAISKQLQNHCTTKYKVHGTVLSLLQSGRKHKLSPAERKLVWMVKSQPTSTKKQVCDELESAESEFDHRLRGCFAGKKPFLKAVV